MSRARGWRSSNSKNRKRSSYACITAPELIASMDIDGTTTIVCGSWLKCSIDFHSGTSFRWSCSNSPCESAAAFSSDIKPVTKTHHTNKSRRIWQGTRECLSRDRGSRFEMHRQPGRDQRSRLQHFRSLIPAEIESITKSTLVDTSIARYRWMN